MVDIESSPKWQAMNFNIGSAVFVEETSPVQGRIGSEAGFIVYLGIPVGFFQQHA